MSELAGGKANELTFHNDMLKHSLANGWLQGQAWAA